MTVELTTFVGVERANAALVAFRDGDGPWTLLEGDQGQYRFLSTQGRHGLATVCTWYDAALLTDRVEVWVHHALSSERSTYARQCPMPQTALPPMRDVEIAVTGLTSHEVVSGGLAVPFSVDASNTATFTERESSRGLVLWSANAEGTIGRMIYDPDVEIVGDVSLAYDFAAQAFSPVVRTVQIADWAGEDEVNLTVGVFSEERGILRYDSRILTPETGPASVATVPAARLSSGELNLVQINVMHSLDSGDGEWLRVERYGGELPEPIDIVLPEPLEPPVMTFHPMQSLCAFLQAQLRPEASEYELCLSQVVVATDTWLQWHEWKTQGWLAAVGDAVWQSADLSQVPGWDPRYGLADSTVLSWELWERTSTDVSEALSDGRLDTFARYQSETPR